MGGSKTSFFVLDIILLVVFVNIIFMLFNLTRLRLVAALFIVLVLIFTAFISLTGVYKNRNWGFVLMSLSFMAILVGAVILRYFNIPFSRRVILTTLLSALGFIISVVGIRKKGTHRCMHEDVEEIPGEKEEERVYTNFEPGKYVASKTGTTYHAPVCDWAKKIRERNRVWFDSDKEAKEKGFKKHSCLE